MNLQIAVSASQCSKKQNYKAYSSTLTRMQQRVSPSDRDYMHRALPSENKFPFPTFNNTGILYTNQMQFDTIFYLLVSLLFFGSFKGALSNVCHTRVLNIKLPRFLLLYDSNTNNMPQMLAAVYNYLSHGTISALNYLWVKKCLCVSPHALMSAVT
jgi:hypothetical protein